MCIIFTKLRKNRKGNAAPTLTLAFILFNIFVAIIIQSFADDYYSQNIGSSSNIDGLAAQANESGSSIITTWNDLGFIRQAGFLISELPWWFSLLLGAFQSIFLVVVILAWVRGL